MTGSELADALSASRSRAIAALGQAYVRRADQPDDDLFTGLLHNMGLDDDVAIAFLLNAWRVLRLEKAKAPSEPAARPQEAEPASEKQQAYLARLADEKGFTAPHMAGMSKTRASELIDKLQNGTYSAETDDVPF